MSKQSEVEKAIKTCIAIEQSCSGFDGNRLTYQILRCLKELKVVIKVDRELPINPCEKCELDLSRECNNVCMERTQYEIKVEMLKAGYEAVESLIEEE